MGIGELGRRSRHSRAGYCGQAGESTVIPHSRAELAISQNQLPHDASALILQFVDDFRSRRRSVQRDLVSRRPPQTGSRLLDAYLAGLAEYLSNEVGVPVPAWVEDPDRFLREWWIESDVPSARPTAIAQSPAAFRRRAPSCEA